MNQPAPCQLIDGTFTPAEAARVLHALVKSKIDHHSLEELSNKERFSEDRANSEKRLIELRMLNATLKEVCEAAEQQKRQLKIEGWINLEFV